MLPGVGIVLKLSSSSDTSLLFKVYNRVHEEYVSRRIDGVKIWVGIGLTGGNYEGAENIGTIKYESGTNPYIFSDLRVIGSSVQIQGGAGFLSLAEVEVYGGMYLSIKYVFLRQKSNEGSILAPL